MQRPKIVVAGALSTLALTGCLLTGAASANAADSGSPSSSEASATAPHHGKGQGNGHGKGICHRVPKLEKRIDKALDRLNGDAHTRGSIARMEQRVKNARAKHRDAVATFLQDRLTHRKELKPTLTRERTDLKAVAAWCAKKNGGNQGTGS
ncbi:hypothetical protein HEK616_30340 [Streptomyces nigrescens]|uniref:Lipoprotein n=1 Tax=Streptomyces nigrescens TaxID=1920 RepID=A0ABM7ZTG1_STRNI|nr:hypothetical protein [Streptomyces nigrescens]BDM69547.1 hypothetical protein HEK616_30340 [Streptomyces nigrescens]